MSLRGTLAIVLGEGMRIFFLAAGVYALVAIGVWVWLLALQAAGAAAPDMPFAPPPALWHAHEMIFGYACAVLGGFFLTAVPSWTGEKSARAAFLSVLAALWLAGRLAVWWSGALPAGLVAAADLAFLPVLGARIAMQLVKRPKPQNLMFLGLIALLWSGNLLVHLDWMGLWPGVAQRGLRVGLLTVAAMIAVIGGRVIPAFTRNAMLRSGRETGLPGSRRPAELAGIAAAILLPAGLGLGLPDAALALVALVAGVAQAARLAGWRGSWTLGQPILWSLHLAFAMLASGYLALAAALSGLIGETAALHLIGIGAVGGMTLAMMSRASLGHTGRPLVTPAPVALAYGLVALAALVRFAAGWAPGGWYLAAMLLSGGLWLAGFALFVAAYWPVLTRLPNDAAI